MLEHFERGLETGVVDLERHLRVVSAVQRAESGRSSEQGGGGGFGAHASEFRDERPARDAGRVRGPAPILTVPVMSGVRRRRATRY